MTTYLLASSDNISFVNSNNDDGEKDSSPNFPEKALDKFDFSCIVAI